MGYVIPDLGWAWEYVSESWWLVVYASQGSGPTHHSGFACGPYTAPRDDGGICETLIASAADGIEALGDAIADLPTINAGPFPGVVPRDWFAGLPTGLRAGLTATGAAWASANALP